MATTEDWLIPLTREVCRRGAPPPGPAFADVDAYEAWLSRALHDRGFDLGVPLDALRGLALAEVASYEVYALLNATCHGLMMGLAFLVKLVAGLV